MSQTGTLESFLQSNIQTEPSFPAPTVPEIFEELPGDRALLGTSSRQLELRSGNAMLYVGLVGQLPVWALSRSPESPSQIVCEFRALTEGTKSGVRALTDYERLMKATGSRPWDYLLDTRWSDYWAMRLKEGQGGVNVPGAYGLGKFTPLEAAVFLNKPQIVTWLLANGADPNGSTTTPVLSVAVQEADQEMALQLLNAGANPMPAMPALRSAMEREPAKYRDLALMLVGRLGFIPEDILLEGINRDTQLVKGMSGMGLPIRLTVYYRTNGLEPAIPGALASALSVQNSPELAANVNKITRAPAQYDYTGGALLEYGRMGRGLQIIRYGSSRLPDQLERTHQLELFGTMLCEMLLQPGNSCGPAKLKATAISWAAKLRSKCPVGASDFDPMDCAIVAFYTRLAADERSGSVAVFPWTSDEFTPVISPGALLAKLKCARTFDAGPKCIWHQ